MIITQAGIIDAHVDSAPLLFNFLEHGVDFGLLDEVALQSQDFAFTFDLSGQLLFEQ